MGRAAVEWSGTPLGISGEEYFSGGRRFHPSATFRAKVALACLCGGARTTPETIRRCWAPRRMSKSDLALRNRARVSSSGPAKTLQVRTIPCQQKKNTRTKHALRANTDPHLELRHRKILLLPHGAPARSPPRQPITIAVASQGAPSSGRRNAVSSPSKRLPVRPSRTQLRLLLTTTVGAAARKERGESRREGRLRL